MFASVVLGSNDAERSKRFYDALFIAMGGPEGMIDERGRVIYRHKGAFLVLTPPINGQPATHGNGSTIGFAIEDIAAIDAWHAAGVAAGGVSAEDPPGWRARPNARVYLAYLRDPDGNKICAWHREELS